jgi:hypothetical protein
MILIYSYIGVDRSIVVGDFVIVEADRGEDLGKIHVYIIIYTNNTSILYFHVHVYIDTNITFL